MTFNPSFQTCIPCVESPVEKSNPQPSQKQEENHERERERKPGAEVDAVAVRKVTAKQKRGFVVNSPDNDPVLCLRTAQNHRSPLQLSNQDEVRGGAGERGRSSDTGCVRNTDQESFPDLQLILGLRSDLIHRPHVGRLRLDLRPF